MRKSQKPAAPRSALDRLDAALQRATDMAAAKPRVGSGRRRHVEDYAIKVNVLLFRRQLVALDGLAVKMRGATGRAMKRTELVRAFVDGILESGLDIVTCASEAEVKATVAARLRAK